MLDHHEIPVNNEYVLKNEGPLCKTGSVKGGYQWKGRRMVEGIKECEYGQCNLYTYIN
jgi:hypothetical protein